MISNLIHNSRTRSVFVHYIHLMFLLGVFSSMTFLTSQKMHTDYLMFYYLDSTHFIDEHYFSYFKKIMKNSHTHPVLENVPKLKEKINN